MLLLLLAFSNPQIFPFRLYVRIMGSWQAVLQKSESLFMYHYSLILGPNSTVRQWIHLICKSQWLLIFCGCFPWLNRLVLNAQVPKQQYEKRKSQWLVRGECLGKARRSSNRWEVAYGTPGLAWDSALPELITKLMLPSNLHLFLLVCSLRRGR